MRASPANSVDHGSGAAHKNCHPLLASTGCPSGHLLQFGVEVRSLAEDDVLLGIWIDPSLRKLALVPDTSEVELGRCIQLPLRCSQGGLVVAHDHRRRTSLWGVSDGAGGDRHRVDRGLEGVRQICRMGEQLVVVRQGHHMHLPLLSGGEALRHIFAHAFEQHLVCNTPDEHQFLEHTSSRVLMHEVAPDRLHWSDANTARDHDDCLVPIAVEVDRRSTVRTIQEDPKLNRVLATSCFFQFIHKVVEILCPVAQDPDV
mmetsp:Transcript_30337/g.80856  ORF Transcript_30337/g.80856 Transcript_30337/m.80856 type:complete len:258 (-) Transcript_30337:40-813(-)